MCTRIYVDKLNETSRKLVVTFWTHGDLVFVAAPFTTMFDDMFFAGFDKHSQKEAPPVYMSSGSEDMSHSRSTSSQDPEPIDTDNKQTYRQQDMSPLSVDSLRKSLLTLPQST